MAYLSADGVNAPVGITSPTSATTAPSTSAASAHAEHGIGRRGRGCAQRLQPLFRYRDLPLQGSKLHRQFRLSRDVLLNALLHDARVVRDDVLDALKNLVPPQPLGSA